ncbi:GMP synthase [glutamine-hydrolyzing] subunit A [uncultured archaeon]|nr:GMP synthase [glutamine-hydrolyzing] subunit A [uncultured archaeon]
MILIISTCSETLHELEFVKPIEDIIGKEFKTVNYKDLTQKHIDSAEKIIICGTSLKDNTFLKELGKFSWIKEYSKPLLGICAGMQIIGLVFGGKIKKKKEIGLIVSNFDKTFLGLDGVKQVYALHNNFIDFSKIPEFEVFAKSLSCDQAVKHRAKKIYGVLFHPEVRNKEFIKKFCLL